MSMRAIIITMVVCYVSVFVIGDYISYIIFPWGGVTASYVKPIYLGIIFLSGLIVGCTTYIAELIKEKNRRNHDD